MKNATMTDTDVTSMRQQLNERIKRASSNDWCHRFEIDESNDFVPADNLKYRLSVLNGLFESLFKQQRVLVLNETSGIYPIAIKRAGAASVTANHLNRENCEIMKELSSLTGESFEILSQSMAIFENSNIFVDMDHKESHNYLFALNQIWGLYNASSQSFADVVEACAHYVTDGLIFDWTDAKWANPSEEYNRGSFHNALRERFEYVLSCNEWLTIAIGKLPLEEEPVESDAT